MSMNEKLLEILEANKGAFISGQELSGKLQCSRTAVWKHIEELRQQGYTFEAIRRKGYRLVSKPERLNVGSLLARLPAGFPWNIKYLEQTESTQNIVLQLARDGAGEGTLVIAEAQTSGRGRMGRAWVSPKAKGLWFSFLLKPQIALPYTPQLTLLLAVAVCRAIRYVTGLEAGIKWPNDILLHGRKVCGILVESAAEDERLLHIVAGIGMSVNLSIEDYPVELHGIASSLLIESGRTFSREDLLVETMRQLVELYRIFQEKGFSPIRTLWEALNVTLHSQIRVQNGQVPIEGKAVGLDDFGALLVETAAGDLVKVYSGDIRQLDTQTSRA